MSCVICQQILDCEDPFGFETVHALRFCQRPCKKLSFGFSLAPSDESFAMSVDLNMWALKTVAIRTINACQYHSIPNSPYLSQSHISIHFSWGLSRISARFSLTFLFVLTDYDFSSPASNLRHCAFRHDPPRPVLWWSLETGNESKSSPGDVTEFHLGDTIFGLALSLEWH